MRFFLILLIFCFTIKAQTNLFLKGFMGTGNYSLTAGSFPSIDTLNSNSFVVAGSYSRFANGLNDSLGSDAFFIKNQFDGLTKSIRKYHLNGQTLTFNSVKAITANELLFSATSSPPNNYKPSGLVLKTDSNGSIIWYKYYPYQSIQNAISLSNGNIAVSGTDSSGKIMVAVLNANGVTKWCKKQTSSFWFPSVCGIIEGVDKTILIHGYSPQACAFLFDSIGNKIKDITVTATASNIPSTFYSGISFYNNGFFLVGTHCDANSYLTGLIFRFDNNLNVLWYKSLETANTNSEFFDIKAFNPNALVILTEPEGHGVFMNDKMMGLTFIDSTGASNKNFLITKDSVPIMPSKLKILKNNTILFSGIGWIFYQNAMSMLPCFGITDTATNGFCGYKTITYPVMNKNIPFLYNTCTFNDFNLSSGNAYLSLYTPFDIKVDYSCSNGPFGPLDTLNVSIEKESIDREFEMFPNPASELLKIKTNYGIDVRAAHLSSSSGNKIILEKIKSTEASYFNIKEIPDGFYLISFELTNGKNIIRKLIITH